ncbi:MAG: mxaJ protein [Acidobacteriota bacterium]|nr:mxaJ protein [Acidobacteriota bacterium]
MSFHSRNLDGYMTMPPRILTVAVVLAAVTLHLSCAGTQQEAQQQRPSPAVIQSQPVLENAAYTRGTLRVCSDPNNLPFSNEKLEGFENKIADLIGREMHLKVEYAWWAQRRGFVRNTLKAGLCDIIIGMPSSSELALTTRPYYRSTYVFVSRRDRALNIRTFDDPALRNLRIGVQLIGDDFANTPPAHALTNRKIVDNVKAYSVYGDYARANPPARIIEGVARREVDVAVVWGPLAGYFAKRQGARLSIAPVSPQIDLPYLPFVYDISMGVRRGDDAFKERIEAILERRRADIDYILDEYGVPRADAVSRGM